MRPRRAPVLLLALTCACAVPTRNTISPQKLLVAIEEAEATRDGHSTAIAGGLSHQQRELRLAALRALARTGASGTASAAASLLGDRDREVATWAAFALGEIGEPAGEAALVTALRGVTPVPEEALLALGRSATAT